MVTFKTDTRAVIKTQREGLEVYLIINLDRGAAVVGCHLTQQQAISAIKRGA